MMSLLGWPREEMSSAVGSLEGTVDGETYIVLNRPPTTCAKPMQWNRRLSRERSCRARVFGPDRSVPGMWHDFRDQHLAEPQGAATDGTRPGSLLATLLQVRQGTLELFEAAGGGA